MHAEASADLKKKVRSIIAATFNLPELEQCTNLTVDDVESWTSLGHLKLIMELERTFNVKFSAQQVSEMLSDEVIVRTVSNQAPTLR